MKYLKTYQLFEAKTGLNPKQEAFLDKFTRGTWSVNPQTGLVDVDGDFNCSYKTFKTLGGINFGKVSGDFLCQSNKLTSLAGAPQEVGGHFICYGNQLTNLEGAPQKVGRHFLCQYNNLTSLEGAPQEVGVNFVCSDNNLTSLEGAPQEVTGHFSCTNNKLASLEGAPQVVTGSFLCDKNNLTTLEGAPQEVGVDFACQNNKLTNLKGSPRNVGGDFHCFYNNLESLEGAPGEVGKYFKCDVFTLGPGEWSPKGWIRILKEGKPKAQSLILTIFTPEILNMEIAKDPSGLAVQLKEIWKDEWFKETRSKLVWPKDSEDDAHLAGDLNDLGF